MALGKGRGAIRAVLLAGVLAHPYLPVEQDGDASSEPPEHP